ncbi:MAG: trypsin-like peptidase domain-containing protein [Clostridia bacterium]|nr:trypsin-like peptidase domain-containing protein [Clostridia bacterium]
MKFLRKISVLFLVVAITLGCLAGCADMFTAGGTSESNSTGRVSSDGGLTEKVRLSGDITIHETEEIAMTYELVDMVDRTLPSVVEIYVSTLSSSGAGSGVILDIADAEVDGEHAKVAYIVTCHHVINGANDIVVRSVKGVEYPAWLIGSDPKTDVAVICIKDKNDTLKDLAVASWLNPDNEVKIGMPVVAIGNPLGNFGGSVTNGIVSGISRDITIEGRKMTLIQTDAAINGGNSGGGLFDQKTGALIGIVNAGYEAYAAEGISFAIPSTTANPISRKLLATYGETYGYIEGNFEFGAEFSIRSVRTSWTSYRNYLYIAGLDEFGAFAKGGLKEGDYVFSIKINDAAIDLTDVTTKTLSELGEFLSESKYKIGDKVTVGLARGNSETTLEFYITQYIYGQV